MQLFPNIVIIGKEIGKTSGSGNAINILLPSKILNLRIPLTFTYFNDPIINNLLFNINV